MRNPSQPTTVALTGLALALLAAAPPLFAAHGPTGDYPRSYYEAPEPSTLGAYTMQQMLADELPTLTLPAVSAAACVGGLAGGFPCKDVDLEAFMPIATIGGGRGNDVWGWTDPETGKEYALMGRSTGTSFVDISDPRAPIYLGDLPTHTVSSTWRDIKVYANHAFIVSEAAGHGLQVFDLTRLRAVATPPVTFGETAHYAGFGNSHNVAINEETGFAYAVGTGTCSGGLHIVDIRMPTSPSFAGCFSTDGYTHDTQCVLYSGPDTAHVGREICFAFNEDTLTIADVSDKSAPSMLARQGYPGRGYTHQGWVTPDQRHLLLDDELDERDLHHNTRTHIWNIEDLDSPVEIGFYEARVPAIDHNVYILDNYAYESNYRSGLRILDTACVASAELSEVAFFDTYPDDDDASFNGSWSNFPYYASGVVAVSGIEHGLFVVRPRFSGWRPANPSICRGASVLLDAGDGFDSYLWSTGESTQTITVAPTETTSYSFEVRAGSGCLRSGRETVTVRPAPEPAITPAGGTLCAGDALELHAGAGYASYAWSTGEISERISVAPPVTTRYDVVVTNAEGCSGRTTALVTVDSVVADAGPDASFCPGRAVRLGSPAVPRWTYAWSPALGLDDARVAQPLATPTRPTTYTLVVTNPETDCSEEDEVSVEPASSTPIGMGNVLKATKAGGGIHHEWSLEPAATQYGLSRGPSKERSGELALVTLGSPFTAWTEPGVLSDGTTHFDRIGAAACASSGLRERDSAR